MFISTPKAQKEISFKAVNYTLSRNAINTSSDFSTNDAMYVTAVMTKDSQKSEFFKD